jgi:hypothetical protein
MKDSACQRWTRLSDRVAVGDALTDEEARFEREHRGRCAACAAEARVWEALGHCLNDDSQAPRVVELQAAPAPPRWRSSWWRWGLGAVGATAVAAVAAIVLDLPGRAPDADQSASAAFDARVSVVLVSGEVQIRGAQAAAGAALRPTDVVRVGQGRACLAYSEGSSACADRDTELRLVAADREQRRLMLDAGVVVCRLDAQPPGVRFSVETLRGRITAKGTVFAVQYLPDSEVAVRVHRGVVEVESARGAHQQLRAPAGVVLGHEIRQTVTTGEAWHQDAELIEAADLWAQGAVAPVDIAASPSGALVTLDGVGLGESPVSTLVGRGDHEIVVERPGFRPHRERFVVMGAERVSRSPVLQALPEQPSATADVPSSAAPTPPSAAELRARARSLRSAGRYAEAATAYQSLLSVHPRSAEARAALVSLGELQLSQLGNPVAALRSFDAYLARGGSLAQEARYGRIRALRRLGRSAGARAATEAFLRDYPGSAQAKALRERLGER